MLVFLLKLEIGMAKIGDIEVLGSLKEYNLSNNKLKAEGCSFLKVNENLEVLNLWENNIKVEGVKNLFRNLKNHYNLKEINLSQNNIDDKEKEGKQQGQSGGQAQEEKQKEEQKKPQGQGGLAAYQADQAKEGEPQEMSEQDAKMLLEGYKGEEATGRVMRMQKKHVDESEPAKDW